MWGCGLCSHPILVKSNTHPPRLGSSSCNGNGQRYLSSDGANHQPQPTLPSKKLSTQSVPDQARLKARNHRTAWLLPSFATLSLVYKPIYVCGDLLHLPRCLLLWRLNPSFTLCSQWSRHPGRNKPPHHASPLSLSERGPFLSDLDSLTSSLDPARLAKLCLVFAYKGCEAPGRPLLFPPVRHGFFRHRQD